MIDHNSRLRKALLKALSALFLWSLPFSSAIRVWPEWSLVRGLRIDYSSPALYLADIILLLSLLVLLDRRLVSGFKTGWFRLPLVVAVGLVFLATNLFFSINRPLTAYFGFQWFWTLTAFFYLVGVKRWLGRSWLIRCFGLGLGAQAGLGLVQVLVNSSVGVRLDYLGAPRWLSRILWLFGEIRFTSLTPGIALAPLAGQWRLRAYGTLTHPNILAGFLLIAAIFLLIDQGGAKRKRLNLLALWLGIGLLATSTRTAWATAGLVGLFELSRPHPDRKRRFLAGAGILLISMTVFRERWLSLATHDRSAWTERLVLFQAGWQMFTHRPVFGVGLGAFIAYLPQVVTDSRQTYLLQPVHNGVWLWLAETGMVGLGYLVWIIKKIKTLIDPRWLTPLLAIFLLSLTDHYLLTTHQGRFLLALTFAFTIKDSNVS